MIKIIFGLFFAALVTLVVAVQNFRNDEPAREVYEYLIVAAALGGAGAFLVWWRRRQ
jgi:hypothetical protein